MARRRQVRWTQPALDDLDDIAAFIAMRDPDASARLVARVLESVDLLEAVPRVGRRLPEFPKSAYRELIVPPLRIVYRQEEEEIFIVLVMRSERRLRRTRLR